MTRVVVAGTGLAGTLLAWRLACAQPGWSIELIGPRPASDATSISGGLVRGFEVDLESCRQATESLVELRDDARLRAWGGYDEIGSVYVCHELDELAVAALVADVDRRLPGSARVLPADALCAEHGWSGLPAGCLAVVETHAGYYSPDRLRGEISARLEGLGVGVLDGQVEAIRSEPAAGASCEVAGRRRGYDALVLAAGSWTPRLLAGSDLPADGFRTKAVEYAVYEAQGWRPPAFVDDSSGLYGRPLAGGRILLGIPSERWDVDPDRLEPSPADAAAAAELAASRLPRLRLGPALALRAASDCYAQPSRLSLQPLGGGGLFTFTGGRGGSAKTALCASREAADELGRALSSGSPVTASAVGMPARP